MRTKQEVFSNKLYQAALRQVIEMLNSIIQEIISPHVVGDPARTFAYEYDENVIIGNILMPAIIDLLKLGNASSAEFLIKQSEYLHENGESFYKCLASEAAYYNQQVIVNITRDKGSSIINGIILGTARRGDRSTVDALLAQGMHGVDRSNFNAYRDAIGLSCLNVAHAATGYGQGNHVNYAEELIARGFPRHDLSLITSVACGAAFGGHFKYVNELIARNARLHTVHWAAFQAGFHEFADDLVLRRLTDQNNDLDEVKRRARNEFAFNKQGRRLAVKRAIKFLSLMQSNHGIQEQEAFAITNKTNFGALFFMVSIVAFACPNLQRKTKLPTEILLNIFSYNFGFNSDPRLNKQMGFGLFLSIITPNRNAAIATAHTNNSATGDDVALRV